MIRQRVRILFFVFLGITMLVCILVGCGWQYSGAAKQLYALAQKGDSDAMLTLGLDCLSGKDGAPLDKTEGVKWIEKAAQAGNADAAWHYGLILFCGSYRVPRDEAMFQFWVKKSPRLAILVNSLHETALRCLVYADSNGGMSPANATNLSYGETVPTEIEQAFTFYPCNLDKLADADKSHTVIVAVYGPAFDGTVFIMADGSRTGGPGQPDRAAKERGFVFPQSSKADSR
jgi:hypothetical protein